jgi:hypothetical protein
VFDRLLSLLPTHISRPAPSLVTADATRRYEQARSRLDVARAAVPVLANRDDAELANKMSRLVAAAAVTHQLTPQDLNDLELKLRKVIAALNEVAKTQPDFEKRVAELDRRLATS